jgi:hypothetical protein
MRTSKGKDEARRVVEIGLDNLDPFRGERLSRVTHRRSCDTTNLPADGEEFLGYRPALRRKLVSII